MMQSTGRLVVVPVDRDQALEYIERHHRHSKRPQGYRAAIGAARGEDLVGVAILGRPVARGLQDGWTLEVLRLCTAGARDVCSFLYGAAWRLARALGYRRLITYTLTAEPGTSLRAAGWRLVGEVTPRQWDCPSRPRDPREPQARLRWEAA